MPQRISRLNPWSQAERVRARWKGDVSPVPRKAAEAAGLEPGLVAVSSDVDDRCGTYRCSFDGGGETADTVGDYANGYSFVVADDGGTVGR